MMNCEHTEHGWCLSCVTILGNDASRLRSELADLRQQLAAVRLRKFREENERLKAWRANVTVALQREGGAFFDDVPKHIADLRQQLAAAEAKNERLRNSDRLCNYRVWDNGDMRDCGNATTLRRCSDHASAEIELRTENAALNEHNTIVHEQLIEVERKLLTAERERDEARAFLIPIRDELRSQMLCPMCNKMQNPGSPRNHRDDCAYVKLDTWLAAHGTPKADDKARGGE